MIHEKIHRKYDPGLGELLRSTSPIVLPHEADRQRERPIHESPNVSHHWMPGYEPVLIEETGERVFIRSVGGGVDVKISGLTAATSALSADEVPVNEGGVTKKVTLAQVRSLIGEGLTNASTAAVAAAYAADTYLAGSAITTTAGAWRVGTIYKCMFDMVKTAAGTAAFTITVRMGTLGTTGDASILVLAFAVGTAVIDTGRFIVELVFRTIGSGTAAVLQGITTVHHHLAATGLVTTGASGVGIILGTSAGFNSTTQTILGLSINGGASFSGTNTIVTATADNL